MPAAAAASLTASGVPASAPGANTTILLTTPVRIAVAIARTQMINARQQPRIAYRRGQKRHRGQEQHRGDEFARQNTGKVQIGFALHNLPWMLPGKLILCLCGTWKPPTND